MIKLLRIGISCIFVAVILAFAVVLYTDVIRPDKSIPEITVSEEILDVKIGVDDKTLLEGVTAFDKKDGDLTDRVIVESISKFKEKGICTVNYAVCDNDHHVANAQRDIRYVNYTSPKFTVNESLCFSINRYSDVSAIIGATDKIDGDISKNVIITSDNFKSDVEGNYSLQAKVTNSKGDTISIELPIVVEARSTAAPEIHLSNYITYIKKGTTPNYNSFITKVTDSTDGIINIPVTINSDVNTNKPGLYAVHYYATDMLGRRGHTILNVVVEK